MDTKKILLVFSAIIILLTGCRKSPPKTTPKATYPVTLKVGHVGHDHHLPLFLALDKANTYKERSGIRVEVVEDKKFYSMFSGEDKIADIEIIKVGGGSKMPTALAQGVIDVGLGGVGPVLASYDKGAPVKIISPLHFKGDMFVFGNSHKIDSWSEFVEHISLSDEPVKIGYKSPAAVAKMIFECGLRHEGISYSGDLSKHADVHLINTKGGGKLNMSLGAGLIDGYAGNNPFAAIAEEKGMGRVVCALEELPGGKFTDHPCCCVAANMDSIAGKEWAVSTLLELLGYACGAINDDTEAAVNSAARWIGTSCEVERKSIASSMYSMEAGQQWRQSMLQWIEAMDELGLLEGRLKDIESNERLMR